MLQPLSVLKMLNCIDKWGGEKMHLLFAEDHHDWLLAFSEIGKFKKFLDYRISDLGLNLSDYRISDSEKTNGFPPLVFILSDVKSDHSFIIPVIRHAYLFIETLTYLCDPCTLPDGY